MSESITYLVEQLYDQARVLAGQIGDFPTQHAVSQTQGAKTDAAATFGTQMELVAGDLVTLVDMLRNELEQAETDFRGAVARMAETDAQAADIARTVLAEVEAVTTPATTPSTSTPPPSTGSYK